MSVSIIRDNAPALAALLEKAARGAVRASCEAIEQECEVQVRVRTGALKASTYTAIYGEEKSGYEAAVAGAKERNPKVQIFEEVKPEHEGEGIVSFAAEHSYVNEYGGPHIEPKPVAHNAADHERPHFPARVEKAIAEATR